MRNSLVPSSRVPASLLSSFSPLLLALHTLFKQPDQTMGAWSGLPNPSSDRLQLPLLCLFIELTFLPLPPNTQPTTSAVLPRATSRLQRLMHSSAMASETGAAVALTRTMFVSPPPLTPSPWQFSPSTEEGTAQGGRHQHSESNQPAKQCADVL